MVGAGTSTSALAFFIALAAASSFRSSADFLPSTKRSYKPSMLICSFFCSLAVLSASTIRSLAFSPTATSFRTVSLSLFRSSYLLPLGYLYSTMNSRCSSSVKPSAVCKSRIIFKVDAVPSLGITFSRFILSAGLNFKSFSPQLTINLLITKNGETNWMQGLMLLERLSLLLPLP